MAEIKDKIRSFIVEDFLFGDDQGLEDTTSFLDEGIIDSTGMLELISFLEEQFSIEIADDEMVPENLDSISNVLSFLNRKLGSD
ncbi:MAG: acyl carrier protein [Desulfobacteraceae bacterium]|nr:MAG: acyl carrier protein [Desulfobacteraceae bacterium]